MVKKEFPMLPPMCTPVASGKIDSSLDKWYTSKTVKLETSQDSSYVKKV